MRERSARTIDHPAIERPAQRSGATRVASRTAMGPAGALALQRLAGNAAVAGLLRSAPGAARPLVVQRVLTKGARSRLTSASFKAVDIKVPKVEQWQKAGGINDAGMSRLIMQTDAEDLVRILSHDAKLFTSGPGRRRQGGRAAKPKSALTTRLEETGANESDVTAFLKAEAGETSALNAWLTATPADVARRTVELAVMKHARLAEIQALLVAGPSTLR